ncbi:hypothetical protein JTB14_026998 [Gonioctena quinquepunctata]|nr:hypothetical protein JTB14_026998 [Gonioctena quinquepunctata]
MSHVPPNEEETDHHELEHNQNNEHPFASKIQRSVMKDFQETRENYRSSVNEIKGNIGKLFSYIGGFVTSESSESLLDIDDGNGQSSSVSNKIVGEMVKNSLLEIRKKTSLDLQFIDLYNRFLDKELALGTKTKNMEEHISALSRRVVDDFRTLNEETGRNIELTKSKLEEYLGLSKKAGREHSEDSVVLEKALKDFQRSNVKLEKGVYRTKMNVKDNFGVFLTNPNGRRTYEELQSEKIVKKQILAVKNKIEGDLRASKDVTDKIAQDTRKTFESLGQGYDEDVSICDTPSGFTFRDLQKKTAQEFLDTKAELEQKVSNVIQNVQSQFKGKLCEQAENGCRRRNQKHLQVSDEKMSLDSIESKILDDGLMSNVEEFHRN